MSNFVFVLDTNKKPLDPVNPGLARRLLTQGVAAVYRRYKLTLVLFVPNLSFGPKQSDPPTLVSAKA
jgi:hypothetical protein